MNEYADVVAFFIAAVILIATICLGPRGIWK